VLPSVSVVIPTYKSAAWIEATLQSVVRQTYPAERLEVIVLDDASPDDSASVAEAYLLGKKLRSQVIRRQANRGASATRNEGWRVATGEWIQFLDHDDLLAPHKIQLQAELAARQPESVAVVYSNWQHFTLVDGKWQPTGDVAAPFVDDDPILQILEEFTFGYVGPSLIRRTFLDRVQGFVEKPNISEDMDLMLRIAMAGGQFRQALSESVAFLYRQSPNSLWRNYVRNVEAMRSALGSIKRAEEFLRGRGKDGALSEAARLALAKRYSLWADVYAEFDPPSFRSLMSWLQELGFDGPINLGPRMARASRLIGFERTVRLRALGRRMGLWHPHW